MSLADYTPARTEIFHHGKPMLTVRGLNTDDISALVRHHIQDLQTLVKTFSPDGKLLPENPNVDALLFSLITKFPTTAARMIALAADEPDQIENARKLPFPLQMEIALNIVKLTFEDVGGPLAFAGIVRHMMAELSSASPRSMIQ